MTKEDFIAINEEYGFTRLASEQFWDQKPPDIDGDDICHHWVRESTAMARRMVTDLGLEEMYVRAGFIVPRAELSDPDAPPKPKSSTNKNFERFLNPDTPGQMPPPEG